MSRYFPLAPGLRGEAVHDLQRRLTAIGFAPIDGEAGVFCRATTVAVSAFQTDRGLHASGECDESTWLALVEASYTLGDRPLVLRAPMLRGDDVADLQQNLSQVGFDCGRPDGIFGPRASRALIDFQRNSGLVADGICGRETVRTLRLVSEKSGSGPGVASIREAEGSRAPAPVNGLRLVIGQFGGLSSIARSVARALRESGAVVISTDEYDAHAQAAAANRFGADAYLGFEARPQPSSVVSYFAVPSFESVGGRALATRVVESFHPVLGLRASVNGMRLPVLRETRMPAVLCSVGPVRHVVDHTEHVSHAIVRAVTTWSESPLLGTDSPVD